MLLAFGAKITSRDARGERPKDVWLRDKEREKEGPSDASAKRDGREPANSAGASSFPTKVVAATAAAAAVVAAAGE